MNFLRNSISKVNSILTQNLLNSYSTVLRRAYSGFETKSFIQLPLLQTKTPVVNQICSFKVKLKLQKRCKDCYLVVRDGRKYIICPTHPRHKQMSMVKKPRYTWILTHASQSKIRPW
ncbi:hypothetical protein O3M35_011585 [Rhynocoris fuscipes]|uniref:Ribosomal protein n=1 Tax=Rhynocoris fuscipes TaxID=488301 RepID=A0AAW1CYN4_9HEMI